jgi:protein tyrosine/serine phosphatase
MLWSCGFPPVPMLFGLPYNFHVVDDGRLYRSGQPKVDELEEVINTFNIRTLINLRGSNQGKDWYDEEAALCHKRGVTLVDHALSARSLPPGEVLAAVINTFQTAEYPILLKCASGSDRSGMVSAIYRMVILGEDRTAALEELAPSNFYLRYRAPCMATLVEMFEPEPEWLAHYATIIDQIECTP